ncbi:p21-activated protein kinase-interacting protein 1-like [Sitodiplosis mosellana]|uniref:p21-activated protein kinase-interacting protein 1-like n=1 Tax=Sitodiplosis mosellana TaxID=263140 RepID=UPI002443E516|nr:p21-activated protein kinase-interacting protein 1-like [Sitodiplosis mosellana]
MATNLEVIVGTYEQFLLGYKVEQDGDDKYSMHQSFAVHAHIASIRTVHAKGKYLASGGADDRVYVYDMKKRQEIQLLTTHNAMINHIRFTPDATHLFTASSDGSLAATRTGSWISEGKWKAPHNGKAITQISIHPSGKLALTLGADLTLKTWNLVKGRQIFTTNLKSKSKLGYNIEFVEFGPSGDNFVLSGAQAVEVWSIEKAGVIKTIPCESKPTSLCWLDENNLLIGLNDGKLVWDHLEKDEPVTFQMYENRVKGLHYQNDHLASISSNGDITVWTVNIDEQKITELCTTNIGCRPICLTIINLEDFADEYVLKRESSDDETVEGTIARKNNVNSSKKVGKVVIEKEDDDDDDGRNKYETPAKRQKSKDKTPKNTPQNTPKNKPKTPKGKTPNGKTPNAKPAKPSQVVEESTPVAMKNKRKSLSSEQPMSAKKSKLKRASISNVKNRSGFIEEDM